jgi:hypothetical protein
MKRTILIMVTVLAVIAVGCSKKTKDFVYLGQIYGTFSHTMQKELKGKVKEFKQTTYWAEEVDGKIVKGKKITWEERNATNAPLMIINFCEEYNSNGIVTRNTDYDDQGKTLTDIKVDAEGKIMKRSEYYVNDTLRAYVKYRYEGGNLVEAVAYNPVNDTVYMSIKYIYDENSRIIQHQTFNFKGEPQGYFVHFRDGNGNEVRSENFNRMGKQTAQYDNFFNGKGDRIAVHQQYLSSNRVSDIYTFKYEYDEMGNYTAEILLRYNKPLIYRERQIKYYE